MIRLVAGLGNPGREYQGTRHNVGFEVLDRLAALLNISFAHEEKWEALVARGAGAGAGPTLLKPQTFMNLSGLAVAALMKELQMENTADLIVLYDDLALPLGTLRIRERGSAGGHNGVKSISSVLGTEEWLRIRIGVGKPPLEDGREIKAGGKDYLLSPMRKAELAELDVVLDRVRQAAETVIAKGTLPAMNEFNRRENGPPED